MKLQWRLLVVVSIWNVVHSPVTKVNAMEVFDPMVIQVQHKRNERLSEPVEKESVGGRQISIVGDQFMLDGKPLRIVSGSLHYFRLPAAYWRDRLHKLKAAGLNSVTTYVEWSYHEPEERQYSFEGDRDIANFLQIAADEGLHVLLRVGPYICGERDLGGLPYWLLGKYPNIKLRTTDKNFIQESKIWVDKLFGQVSRFLYGNGGPIILVQVENEYGSYGSDMPYKVAIRDMLANHVGSNALLFTTDGAGTGYFTKGAVPNALTTIDFGAGTNVNQAFRTLRKYMRSGPLMNSEYYTGWLTHWGEHFQRTDAKHVVNTLAQILDYGANVNFYMFFGGSNFEYTSGANYDGTYKADITSYDYDSPLTEAGDPTPKYYLIRNKLKEYGLVDEKMDVPQPTSKGAYGVVNVSCWIRLLDTQGRSQLGKKYSDVTGSLLPSFEHLRQRAGMMLYEIVLPAGNWTGLLETMKPRDLIFVFVDGVFKGHLSRMHKIYSLHLDTKEGSTLSLLVESLGRINYGNHLHDYKGILSPVLLNGKVLEGKWSVTGYPLEKFDTSHGVLMNNNTVDTKTPAIFEGQLKLPEGEEPKDTFIDTTGWGKGYIWVNGYNLGRYWPRTGPQVTLYVPGVWLKPAPQENHLQILELETPAPSHSMEFIDHPILDRPGNVNFYRFEINTN